MCVCVCVGMSVFYLSVNDSGYKFMHIDTVNSELHEGGDNYQ